MWRVYIMKLALMYLFEFFVASFLLDTTNIFHTAINVSVLWSKRLYVSCSLSHPYRLVEWSLTMSFRCFWSSIKTYCVGPHHLLVRLLKSQDGQKSCHNSVSSVGWQIFWVQCSKSFCLFICWIHVACKWTIIPRFGSNCLFCNCRFRN